MTDDDRDRTDYRINPEAVEALVAEATGASIPVIVETDDTLRDWGEMILATDSATGTLLIECRIVVRAGITAEMAVRTILHEVEHVKQYVLNPFGNMREWADMCAMLKRKVDYSELTYEREAHAAEEHWPSYGWLLEEA